MFDIVKFWITGYGTGESDHVVYNLIANEVIGQKKGIWQ